MYRNPVKRQKYSATTSMQVEVPSQSIGCPKDSEVIKSATPASLSLTNPENDNYAVSLDFAPTLHPTDAEFDQPLAYWESLSELGEKFGAVKMVAPDSWQPPFSLDIDALKFAVREQNLKALMSKFRAFRFPKRWWKGKDFKSYNDYLKEQYQFKSVSAPKSNFSEYTIEELEQEYWYLLQSRSKPVKVYYGADLEVLQTGSGFPHPNQSDLREATHPWNLLNLPASKGSLFQHFALNVSGVTSPWLYIGMLFSTFCWHAEDDYFASVNYQHLGDPKVWYVVPPSQLQLMEELLSRYYAGVRNKALHSLSGQIPPKWLMAHGIRIYKIVQNPREFVLLWPGAYHSGFNTGLNCNEACNVASYFWIPWGVRARQAYRFLRSPCIPYEQIILIACAKYASVQEFEKLFTLYKAFCECVLAGFEARQKIDPRILQIPFIISDAVLKVLDISGIQSQLNKQNAQKLYQYCQDAHASQVNLSPASPPSSSSSEQFLKQIHLVAHLPSPVCSECQATCYLSTYYASRTNEILCLQCLETRPTVELRRSKKRAILYRFPAIVFGHLKFLIENQLIHLYGLEKEAVSLQGVPKTLHFTTDDIVPLDLKAYQKLEQSRAFSFPLGRYGFFVWKPEINERSRTHLVTAEKLMIPLLNSAFANEVLDTSSAEDDDDDDDNSSSSSEGLDNNHS